MRLMRMLGALALVVLFAGCAGTVKKQAFNRDANGHVKTVVIAQAPNQESYEAAVLGHPGMGFGLIGGLVAAADIQTKSSKLTAAINPGETRLQERFAIKLREELEKAGYASTVIALPKDTKEEQVLPLARQKAAGDAVLTVHLVGAYWAAGPSTDYFPRVLAKVKAVDTAKGGVLYEDTFTYGYATPQVQTIHLASDAQYRFANIDTLVGEPEKTRQGLYSGVDAIVGQIVADLKKP